MNEPLALILYERLSPGSQLVNRLQDLKYRVQTISAPGSLVQTAQEAKPLLVLADLEPHTSEVCAAITGLKANPATKHLPVVAFRSDNATTLEAAAVAAGVTLVVGETAILNHLPQFLEQALQVE